MRIGALRFNKEAMLQAPPPEVALFLALAHATNEINALQRLVLWSTDYSSPNQVVVHGQVALSYIVLRLLAGKLNEGHNLLNRHYFGSSLSRAYDPHLPDDARTALKKLNRYFAGTNLIREIRDRFSFHYDADEFLRALPNVNEELLAYLQEDGSANNLYYLAEVIAGTAAVTATSATGIDEGLRSFTEDLIQVARNFITAADGIIAYFITTHPEVTEESFSEVTLPPLIPTLEVNLPWFTDPTDLPRSAA